MTADVRDSHHELFGKGKQIIGAYYFDFLDRINEDCCSTLHPQYFPDLAPCDFIKFLNMQIILLK